LTSAAVAGALFASGLSSTGEPANYDFQVSILALCIVIVGGIGSITGVLVGAIVMVGLSNVLLPNLTQALQRGLRELRVSAARVLQVAAVRGRRAARIAQLLRHPWRLRERHSR
jgi:ABC-type branched-subunit amino acid transport system permease subunit